MLTFSPLNTSFTSTGDDTACVSSAIVIPLCSYAEQAEISDKLVGMITTALGTQIYSRQEAIEIGEEDPGEGNDLLVFSWWEDGSPLVTSSCIAGRYFESSPTYPKRTYPAA
jgi:hypothetical protein